MYFYGSVVIFLKYSAQGADLFIQSKDLYVHTYVDKTLHFHV